MALKVIKNEFPGLLVIIPDNFKDERGSFCETYNKNAFKSIGLDFEFLQDNQSVSNKGVLRGLHFQNPPFEQGKLIRVARGSVMDIVVDIRKNSPQYGKYFSIILSEENNQMLWVPPGFAHGFLTLEDNTTFIYKCTQVYNKASEGAILWNDPDLNIDWNIEEPNISEKDKNASKFIDFSSNFSLT